MPITTPTAFAADGQPDAPRQYPAGREPTITAKGSDLAHGGTDIDTPVDKGH